MMKSVKALLLIVTGLFFFSAAHAENMSVKAENMLKDYMNETSLKVKQAKTPAQKRLILNHSFNKLGTIMNKLEKVPGVSEKELSAIRTYRERIEEKASELNGDNGYEPVPDSQLNSFANYVVQDMEQADKVITISLTTALLIVIILLLL